MKYYCDGYLIDSNPSPKGGGYTVVDENNELVITKGIDMPGMTNNHAELLSIHAAASHAQHDSIISSDSMTAISWTHKGRSKVRHDLLIIARECKELMLEKNITLVWEPRELNLAGHYNEQVDTAIPSWVKARRDKLKGSEAGLATAY
jgi:ribonuclease HI